MAAMTPKVWTKGSIKTHVGWSTKTLFAIRGDLLDGADGKSRNIGPAVERLATWVGVELEWLAELEPVPEHLTRSERASFLKSYSENVGGLATDLNDAIGAAQTTGSVDPKVWEPVGRRVLTLLAHGENVYRI